MVQVDVFWAYGWGASLAVAAGRHLQRKAEPEQTRAFLHTALFLSLAWAPTGMLLLLRHPSWETMQAAENLAAVPPWLVVAFGITNVTQGLLGYWVGARLLRGGRWHAAQLNWIAGYFGMFFILLYGWDGLGYDRFLYDRDLLAGSPTWTPGVATAGGVLPALATFARSGVAATLAIDGAWLLPPFFLLAVRWTNAGRRLTGEPGVGAGRIVAAYLLGVILLGFGGAALAAASVRAVAFGLGIGDHVGRALGEAPAFTARHVASYVIGLPLATLVLWFGALRPGGAAWRLLAPLRPAG